MSRRRKPINWDNCPTQEDLKKDLKNISVATNSGLYQIIKSEGEYQIDVKDYSVKIVKEKHKGVMMVLKKDLFIVQISMILLEK